MAIMREPVYCDAMMLSSDPRWRIRLVSLIALGLLATQAGGFVHAADPDAHDGSKPCQICKVVERTGTALPMTAIASPLFASGEAQPAYASTSCTSVPRSTRPPARASPR